MLELPREFSIDHLDALRSLLLMIKGHLGRWSELPHEGVSEIDLKHFAQDGGNLNFGRGNKDNTKIRAVYNIVYEYFRRHAERKKPILPIWKRLYSEGGSEDRFSWEELYTNFAETDRYYKDIALAYCGKFITHKRGSGRKSDGEVVRSILRIDHAPRSRSGYTFEWIYPVRNHSINSKITGDLIVGPTHIYFIGYDHGSYSPSLFITPTPRIARDAIEIEDIREIDGVSLRSSTNGTIVAARAYSMRTGLDWSDLQNLVDIYSTGVFISGNIDTDKIISRIDNFDNQGNDFVLRAYER